MAEMCGRSLFQSTTLACNSVYVAHPDEISVAKFRLTSALGRQGRPGLGCTGPHGCARARGRWAAGAGEGGSGWQNSLLSPGRGARGASSSARGGGSWVRVFPCNRNG